MHHGKGMHPERPAAIPNKAGKINLLIQKQGW